MITVLFSCSECGLVDRSVEVRFRYQNEDVIHWFEWAVTPALMTEHGLLSPLCYPKELKGVKIPHSGGKTKGIGMEDSLP